MRAVRTAAQALPPPPLQQWLRSAAADGTVWTAGDWTTVGGTWSSDGAKISTTSPGGGAHSRAVRKAAEAGLTGYRYAAVDAEVLVPAAGFVGTGTQFIGVFIGPAAAGTAGAVLQIASNNTLQVERDALALAASTAFTPTANTWYRLSILLDRMEGPGTLWGYKDGVLMHTAVGIGSTVAEMSVPGIKTYSTAASFRNFRAWQFNYMSGVQPTPF